MSSIDSPKKMLDLRTADNFVMTFLLNLLRTYGFDPWIFGVIISKGIHADKAETDAAQQVEEMSSSGKASSTCCALRWTFCNSHVGMQE